jgi:ssDNA-binding Zn-finger/Zn-ribbon topoisomerase 1
MNYECPKCKMDASNEAWDEQSEEFYGNDITPINKAYKNKNNDDEVGFICPNCLEIDIPIYKIKKVKE